jgi:hypothetical protein
MILPRVLLSFRFSLCFAAALEAAAACGGHGDRTSMLVSTEWFASHLNDAGLVVIGVGPAGVFAQGHIPGAVSPELAERRQALS